MTFYSDMADTATDLLTEFGRAITLSRRSLNFDDATNQPISGGTVNHSTIGIFTAIRKSIIDGTRIAETDRVMCIDASVVPRMGDLLDVSGLVSAEAVGAAPGVILSAGQSVSWTIVGIREINPAGTPVCYFVQVRR